MTQPQPLWLWGLALIGTLLTGCLNLNIDCGGSSDTSATWEEPGLYDRIPPPGEHGTLRKYSIGWYERTGLRRVWHGYPDAPPDETWALRVEESNLSSFRISVTRADPDLSQSDIYERLETMFVDLNLTPLTLPRDTKFPDWHYQCA